MDRLLKILSVVLLAFVMVSPIYSQDTIVLNNLTVDELVKYLKIDPETQLPTLFDNPAPSEAFERKVEPPAVQQIILLPLEVEEGPQFVVPMEIFRIKVRVTNKGDIPIPLALPVEIEPGLIERIIGFFTGLWERFAQFIGIAKPPEKVEKVYEIRPIYYVAAALDPQSVTVRGQRVTVVRPGGSYEVEPGYGCYDIVLMNELQLIQLWRSLKEGKISYDDIFCGKFERLERVRQIIGWGDIDSLAGPVTVVPPTELVKEKEEYKKAYVYIDPETNKVIGVVGGCVDKGDGEDYIYTDPETGKKKVIKSIPKDCLLNPGESAEFYIYGWVNPLPAFMVSPQAVPDILSTIYGGRAEEVNIREKYPAVHELYIMIGRVNDVQVGVTLKDFVETIGSVFILGGTTLAGFAGLGPFGAVGGFAAGAFTNYLLFGSWLKLDAFTKTWDCIQTGRCIYEVTTLYMFKTYLIVATPELEVTLTLEHLGFVAAAILIGSALGYRYGARG